ncbi:MAG: hypothetical protein JXR96_10425 [Deltaproteobacteria bacterium]|nr:hypothetical protein [Deltaproteobacteria bacterium]
MPEWKTAAFAWVVVLGLAVSAALRAEIRPVGAEWAVQRDLSFDAAQNTYSLTATGTHVVSYRIDLDDADLQAGMLRVTASVDRGPYMVIVSQAGTRYRDAADAVLEPEEAALAAGARLMEHRIEGDAVLLRWTEQPGAHLLEKRIRLSLAGLSLEIRFESASTRGVDGYAGVSLGHAEGLPGSRVVKVPYLPEAVALLPSGEVLCAYIDPAQSSAISVSGTLGTLPDGDVYAHGRSLAEPDTAGVGQPLAETAYVTLSGDLADVLPRVTGAGSPYRSLLSPLVVMDVWGLHRSFGVAEGVAYSWESPEAGPARLTVRYADLDPSCGDGVAIIVRFNGASLARLPVANGQTEEGAFQADLDLVPGDRLRFEIDRAGNNNCDGTRLRATIDTPADLFDTQSDFSSTQGQRSFSYLEFVGEADTPMTFDEESGQWHGTGSFSRLWPGGGHPGAGKTVYLDAANMVRRYLEYGLARLAIIFHVWQRWGYDRGLPDHHPANPDWGTGPQMAAFVSEAVSAGMRIALHENYTDLYPDNAPDYPSPLWDPTAIALDRYGNRKLGWYHEGTQQQAFVIKASRMQGFADMESPSIAADYGPNAAYLDVTTGWSPGRAIDHDAADNAVPTLADAYAATVEHFESVKAIYAGPLFGEGGEGSGRYDSYFAGYVDAVERQTEGRMRARVAPDYELGVVRPRMLNHGLGYYSRYFVGSGQKTPDLSEVDLDQYRASEIAFGHAGFLGDSISGVRSWMHLHAPEYWLMQALQSRYAEAGLLDVAYSDQAGWLDLETALRNRLDLSRARVRIRYDSGLVVYVNRDSSTGRASSHGDFSHEQGLGGWRYDEDSGSGLEELTWDPVLQRWQGAGTYSFIDRAVCHPEGGAIVRSFSVPASAGLAVRGSVEDLDLGCGDGVIARLLLNGAELWSCDLPGDVASPCGDIELDIQAGAGDVLAMRIEEKAHNWCDSTSFLLELSWDDGQSHDWPVDVPGGVRVLPPSGFFAFDPSGFEASSARPAGSAGDVVDRVAAPEYRFARSRDGVLRSIGAFVTDGAVAVVPRPDGDDLHALHLIRAELDGILLLASSVRADVNLRFIDHWRALITVREAEGGQSADVTWGDLPVDWEAELAAYPENLSLLRADDQGIPLGSPLPLGYDLDGHPVLAGLVADQVYLLRLEPECPDPPCCGDGRCEGQLGENCSNCPDDCPIGPGQVCCDGVVYTGDCCDDADCEAERCVDHVCRPDSDGGPDAGEDAGPDGGRDGGSDAGADSGDGPGPAGEPGCSCGSHPAAGGLLLLLVGSSIGLCRCRRRGGEIERWRIRSHAE